MFQEEKMTESGIERHLVNGVKNLGGMCVKFVSPGTPGVPDRIIITARGRIIFVELKTETGRLAKIQRYTIDEMQKRGADVRVVKGLDNVKALLVEIEGGENV
jgi:Holliday junction resolvase